MQYLPANIYSVAAVREMDRTAIEEHGIDGYTLMQRAGEAALRFARQKFPDEYRWQVVCGAGNNAGDGYVVARLASREGVAVSCLTLVNPLKLVGDAKKAHDSFVAEGGQVAPFTGELDADAGIVIDALLGSGIERDVSGGFAQAVAAINAHPGKVHALDIPTGINGDTGTVMGSAVRADLTTTFVGLKAGLFLGAGKDFCGELSFAGLEIPDECRAGADAVFRGIDDDCLKKVLPPRSRVSHKGDFGHVLVVGGGPGMPGAARLCAEAALRTGAGRVSVATDPSHAAVIAATRPELMCHGIADAASLNPLLAAADVIAFGPGLGQTAWASELFEQLRGDRGEAVWDADALNWLAGKPNKSPKRIITPHPGEAATLLGQSSDDVQRDRPAALDELAKRYGGTVVLKGAGSLTSGDAGVPRLCTSGNPGMAAPGVGDVLTGMIAALYAQGLSAELAAAVGVEVHARAGDMAARVGERGLIASDLIAAVRTLVNP